MRSLCNFLIEISEFSDLNMQKHHGTTLSNILFCSLYPVSKKLRVIASPRTGKEPAKKILKLACFLFV